MTDHPVIMSAPMILGCLREVREPGTGKTETRRLLYSDRVAKGGIIPASATYLQTHRPPICMFGHYWTLTGWHNRKSGDRLWCRETAWYGRTPRHPDACFFEGGFVRLADGKNDRCIEPPECFTAEKLDARPDVKKRPSIHMPRWASRLTLIVTDVRIERLQDIDEAAARREGCGLYVPGHGWITTEELRADPGYSNYLCARLGFQDIWQTLYGAESWDANPWVVAVRFRPILANIDALEIAA